MMSKSSPEEDQRVAKVESQISPEVKEEFAGSTMSRAGRLAMELNVERKRLKQEMEELQLEVEDLKPATPTGTIDSYVKWGATVLGVSGIFAISAGFVITGQICYASAASAWVYVGHCWNDKAIMIGSSISGTAVLMNLVDTIMVM